MNYRRFGRTGLRISELSFGSWVTFGKQVDVKNAAEMMAAAYDAGVNFFDNAEAYARGKSEEIMGSALRKLGKESGDIHKRKWGHPQLLLEFNWASIPCRTNTHGVPDRIAPRSNTSGVCAMASRTESRTTSEIDHHR